MKKALFMALLLSFINLQYGVYAEGVLSAKTVPVQTTTSVPTSTTVMTQPANTAVTVQQAQVSIITPKIDVTAQPVILNSRLRSQYKGFNYTITNTSGAPLELLNAQVVNGQNGQAAALGVQKSSAAVIGTTLGGGLVLGIVTLGITFLVALVASPIIYATNHHCNTKAIAEGNGFSNQIPTGVMNVGDNIKFATLVPLSQIPQVKMTFRNMTTNEIFSVTK